MSQVGELFPGRVIGSEIRGSPQPGRSQNPHLTHLEFPPFAKDAKDGAPAASFLRQLSWRVYFRAVPRSWHEVNIPSPLTVTETPLGAGCSACWHGVLRRAENALLRMTAFLLEPPMCLPDLVPIFGAGYEVKIFALRIWNSHLSQKMRKMGHPLRLSLGSFRGKIYFSTDPRCSREIKISTLTTVAETPVGAGGSACWHGVVLRAENALLRMTAVCLSG
jgi:hypothetical protein